MNLSPDFPRLWPRLPIVQLASAVLRRFHDGRCAQVAGSLAFTTLLSLVPMVTLVAVVFSKLPQSARFGDALRGFLLDNLLPDKAGKVIATYALQFSEKAANLTVVGVLVLIATTMMLMKTIDQVINQIWMVNSRRPWATRLAAYWAALSLGPFLLAGCVFAASAMLSLSLDAMSEPAWLEGLGVRLIAVVVLTGVFGSIYLIVPHCSVRIRDALIAGLCAAMGFLLMQRLFGLYLAHFPSYTLVYGAFAAVPIFLLWLYLSWIVILLGAVLAAVLPERKLVHAILPAFPGRDLFVAMLTLRELVGAQREGGSRTMVQLAELTAVGHEDMRMTLEVLESAGIAARLDGGGWLLARAADAVPLTEIGALFGLGALPDSWRAGASSAADVGECWSAMLAAFRQATAQPIASLCSRRAV